MTERVKSEALDAILGQHFPVLDKGFIRVVDYMGDDSSIVQAARVSYGAGTKTPSDDRSLIRYMMRHGHTSPFEQCEIKLHVKLPIFVARQWMRHRIASYNEVSGRYSMMENEFYLPDLERFTRQAEDNKQGSSEEIIKEANHVRESRLMRQKVAYKLYKLEIEKEVSREIARTELPLSAYTEFYFKIDLHNLSHFLKLRLDKHAQYEIRAYAEAIAELVKLWVPHAWEAFVDYRLEAVTLSRMEVNVLKALIENYTDVNGISMLTSRDEAWISGPQIEGLYGMSKREITEFLERWK